MSIKEIIKSWRDRWDKPGPQKAFHYLKISLVVLLFLALFFVIPVGDVLHVLKAADLRYFAAGVVLGLIHIYLKSISLGFLTRTQGMTVSVHRLFFINLIVKFYLLFLPGAVLGSGIRWGKITSQEKATASLAAVAYQRVLDVILLILNGTFWFLLYSMDQIRQRWITAAVYPLAAGLVWFLFFSFSGRLNTWLDRITESRLEQHEEHWFWSRLARLTFSLNKYGDLKFMEITFLYVLGILIYMTALVSYAVLATAIGIRLSIIDLGWILAVVDLAAITPFSIAGGLGIREVSHVVLLSLYDIRAEVALAFSFLLFGRTVLLSWAGGVIEIFETILPHKDS